MIFREVQANLAINVARTLLRIDLAAIGSKNEWFSGT
jgi:hypothetical protein